MQQLIGIILHAIGGFSSASFYVPSAKLRRWSWETYWITLGLVAWVIMPPLGAWLTVPDLGEVLRQSPRNSMFWTYVFGVLWGFGGLLSGLGLRYLGLSLGQSISLGVCAIVGTLVPAFMENKADLLINTFSGSITLTGFLVCLVGIICCGYAGLLKDRQLSDEQKKTSVKEFSAVKGMILATLGGIMSACMALALSAGSPITDSALQAGTMPVFMHTPVFVFAMAGGFTTNFVYTMLLAARRKSFGDYALRPRKDLWYNYFLSLISGLMWYGQFFFYGMGSTKMGMYDFASWSLHMSSIIIFSNLWGLWLNEWKLVGRQTKTFLWAGIVLLIFSMILIGIGNHLAAV